MKTTNRNVLTKQKPLKQKKTYSEVTEQIRSLQFFMTLHVEVKILYIYYVCILHIYVSNM